MSDGQVDRPSYEQRTFFEQAVVEHSKVRSIDLIDDHVYQIERRGELPSLIVYLTDLYTVGFADVLDIKARCRDVNCIVTISNWNEYTNDAKAHAFSQNIGLFTFREFMGALNWTQIWKYRRTRKV